MVFTSFTQKSFAFIVTLMVLGLVFTVNISLEADSATFAGRVVNVKGKPVDGVSITLLPVEFRNGNIVPIRHIVPYYPSFQRTPPKEEANKEDNFGDPLERMVPPKSKSNSNGHFKFLEIKPGMYQLAVGKDKLPTNTSVNFNSDLEIQAIQIGKITLQPPPPVSYADALTFGIKEGAKIEDVEITVKFRTKIHGKILYKDGLPLVNARVNITLNYARMDGTETPPLLLPRNTQITDVEGKYVLYIDKPGIYSIFATYQELATGSEFFISEENGLNETLVLTLDSNAPDPAQRSVMTRPPRFTPLNEAIDVWVANPENLHLYKKIACTSWEDAQAKAILEDAHLVSINSKEEQIWLDTIFRYGPTWIGLTDVEKEGEWQWDSGEPVTYTNWAENDRFPNDLDDEEKDYVIMSFGERQWVAIGRGHPIWNVPRTAIIEKDGLQAKTPTTNR